MPDIAIGAAVAIAQDVLNRINDYQFARRNYIRLPPPGDGRTWSKEADLGDVADQVAVQCVVCVKGAALISRARLYDAVPADVVDIGQSRINAYLADEFDEETLELIEAAFECSCSFGTGAARPEYVRGAAVFGMNYKHPRDRARAILENVIRNNGRLVVPPADPDDYYVKQRDFVEA
jgi:hypothetical protein